MQMPLTPPRVPDLMARHGPSLARIIEIAGRDSPADAYWHWDELRYRTPPGGLNHEQWWLSLKIMRQLKPLPFIDRHGHGMYFSITDRMLRACHVIDSQTHGRLTGSVTSIADADRDRYVISSMMEEAASSSLLEGAVSTRKEASDMIRSGRKPRNKGEQMILNNFLAMQRIRELKNEPMDKTTLFDLHVRLTDGTLDNPDAAGRPQRPDEARVKVYGSNADIVHEPPAAAELDERLERLIRFANDSGDHGSFIHPVVRGIILHFMLAYDHPFEDGNGRLARALFYWHVLRNGYWVFEFLPISGLLLNARAQYAKSFLYCETDGNDLTYFIHRQLDVILRSIEHFNDYVARKSAQLKAVEDRIKGMDINHRQLALLSHALRTPGHEYTVTSHRNSHAVAYATAKSDLDGLVDLALLNRIKRGKAFHYLLVDGIFDK